MEKTLEIIKISELNNIFQNESLDKPDNNIKINNQKDKNSYECVERRVNSFFFNHINSSIKSNKDINNILPSVVLEQKEYVKYENNNENIELKASSTRKQKNLDKNIYSQFKNIIYDPKGIIEKKDADIVEIKSDGNCLYRAFSYFRFGNQNYYNNIKNLIIEWIENNYEIFTPFYGDDDNINVSKEQLTKEEYEYIFCIIFKIDVAVFNERNGKYTRYFLFHKEEIIDEEIIILLYVNNNHYELIYPKFENMKDKKLYNKPEDIQIDNNLKSFLNKNTYKKTSKNMLLLII